MSELTAFWVLVPRDHLAFLGVAGPPVTGTWRQQAPSPLLSSLPSSKFVHLYFLSLYRRETFYPEDLNYHLDSKDCEAEVPVSRTAETSRTKPRPEGRSLETHRCTRQTEPFSVLTPPPAQPRNSSNGVCGPSATWAQRFINWTPVSSESFLPACYQANGLITRLTPTNSSPRGWHQPVCY